MRTALFAVALLAACSSAYGARKMLAVNTTETGALVADRTQPCWVYALPNLNPINGSFATLKWGPAEGGKAPGEAEADRFCQSRGWFDALEWIEFINGAIWPFGLVNNAGNISSTTGSGYLLINCRSSAAVAPGCAYSDNGNYGWGNNGTNNIGNGNNGNGNVGDLSAGNFNIGNSFPVGSDANVGFFILGSYNRGLNINGDANDGVTINGVGNGGSAINGVNNIGSLINGKGNLGSAINGVNNQGSLINGDRNVGSVINGNDNLGSEIIGNRNVGSRIVGNDNYGQGIVGNNQVNVKSG